MTDAGNLLSLSPNITNDSNLSPNIQDTEYRLHLWENDPLKRSLESSSKPLKGIPESQVLQDPAVPSVQRRKLDPLPKQHRHLRKGLRTKRMRKSKKEEHMEAQCPPPPLLTPSAPPQNEDKSINKKPTLLSTQEDGPDLPSEDRLQSQQDEGACVTHQEYQIQPCELSVVLGSGPSSPAAASWASPPLCFGRFFSCVCQTFSRSRKRKPPRRKDNHQAEAGDDAEAVRPGLEGSVWTKTMRSLTKACK
ncbi:PREDICTED: LOW QUALITY PROTEIN: putative uncharacterized protein [Galeopterus variegatus]|uniref:Uncharacterized protein n=1 Tax=Galeopterus variegatus TaxID=482537 RepID=A0ABM0QU14_GALVR|nr:PREDICTED: LOW QUALITY PROTEIN: putative uncharacterized protein [Galeopterus variegatus]